MKGYFFFFCLFTHLVNNSCVYVKITVCVSCVGLDRGVQRVTPVIESLVVDVCHAQVLSIICRLVPDSKADIHRERFVCVCVRLQCQSLTPTHRGQTNALIRSWHAATTFLPLAPSASLSPFLFFPPLLSFYLFLRVSLFPTQTNTFVPISPSRTAARHAIGVEIAGPGCRMKRWGLNWSWLLACWTAREFKKGATARGKCASHGTSLLGHQPQTRTANQASCRTVSVLAGGWHISSLGKWISSHIGRRSHLQKWLKTLQCAEERFPRLFHQRESSIQCCQQAHTQTINSANTGPLLLLQQWSHVSGSVP